MTSPPLKQNFLLKKILLRARLRQFFCFHTTSLRYSAYLFAIKKTSKTKIFFVTLLTCLLCWFISALLIHKNTKKFKVFHLYIFPNWIWWIPYVLWSLMSKTSKAYLGNANWNFVAKNASRHVGLKWTWWRCNNPCSVSRKNAIISFFLKEGT